MIRFATSHDAEQIQAIYAPFCTDSCITFETEAPSVAAMEQRIGMIMRQYPWLVYQQNNQLLGYAYASTHNERAAYQWSVNVSVYIHPQAQHRGIGKGLYTSLFGILCLQGYYNAYAGITLPNPASMGLHTSMGFQPVGTYRNVGYKCGDWRDVVWLELSLQSLKNNPHPPLSVKELLDQPELEMAMNRGLGFVK